MGASGVLLEALCRGRRRLLLSLRPSRLRRWFGNVSTAVSGRIPRTLPVPPHTTDHGDMPEDPHRDEGHAEAVPDPLAGTPGSTAGPDPERLVTPASEAARAVKPP